MRPAAVLFDMDGLLIDSEPLWTVAEVELAGRLGGQWSAGLKARIVGTRLEVAVPTILAWYDHPTGPAEVAEASAFLLDRMVGLFGDALPLRPGAAALLEHLAAEGVPMALVSSSFRVLVDAALKTLPAELFTVTVAGDEVRHGKPDPEPYLTAAAHLGVRPGQCVVFEDSPSGVASAEAAGCLCVGVPDHAPLEELAHRPVLASLEQASVGWLEGLPAWAHLPR